MKERQKSLELLETVFNHYKSQNYILDLGVILQQFPRQIKSVLIHDF